jgi:hypothetical protein
VRTSSRLFIAAVLVVAACGSETPTASPAGATPGPSSAPTVTPVATGSGGPVVAPSAAPSTAPQIDVPTAFIAALGDPVRLSATVAGTYTTKAGATDVSGEYQQSGRDYHLKLVIDPARTRRSLEYTMVLGQRTTPGRGLVLRSDLPAGSTTLASILDALTGVTETGDGSDVFPGARRLAPDASITTPLDFLAAFTPEAAKATPTVQLFAGADGTPQGVLATASWTGKTTGKGRLELRFSISGGSSGAAIAPPADVYKLYTSKRYKLNLAIPTGWEVEPGKDGYTFDKIIGDGDQYLHVYRGRLEGGSLNEWTTIYTRGERKDYPKLKQGKNVVTKLAGIRARRVTFSGTIDGDKVNEQMVVAVRNGYYYVLVFRIYLSDAAAVTLTLDPILKSFRYP